MSMKKLLLSFFTLTSSILAIAQPATAPTWSESISGVNKAEDVYRYAPIATSANGNIYTTGKFTQTLVIGPSFLEPIANSAYLAKYSPDGAAQWAVSLGGAATITAITTDEEENIYIAGVLADEVIFGSTDGQTTKLEGRKADDGSWETSLSSSFIAKYDKEGALKTTRTFVPAGNPDILATGMYYPVDGDLYFKINHLKAEKGTLYASALYTGRTQAGSIVFNGNYLNLWDFMYMELRSGGIFSLSQETLDVTEKIVELSSTEALTDALQYEADAINFTLNNGVLYAACIAHGNVTLATPAGNTTYSFVNNEGDEPEALYNHIVLSINGTQVNTNVFQQPALETTSKASIGGMQVYGNALYIGGVYNEKLTFAPGVTSTNGTDLYVAKLNLENLNVIEAYTSGFDEEETNKNQEVFTSLFIAKGTVYLNGYKEVIADHAMTASLSYTIDAQGIQRMDSPMLVTGAAGNENTMVFAGIDEQHKNVVSHYATVDAIKDITHTGTTTIRFQDDMLYLDEPADITLYSLQGQAVRTAVSTRSLNLNGLIRGCYIVRVKGKNSEEVVKIIKSR